MRIKKHIIILIVTLVLTVPAIHIKQLNQDIQSSDKQAKAQLSLAIVKAAEAEEQRKIEEQEQARLAELARIEAERVAAAEAAQAAEAERQRIAQVEAQRVAVAQAAAAQCGPADPAVVYQVLRELGMSRTAAIQQLGSWKHESGLDPCQKRGDSGIAWGLNSWHPGRRADMPENLRDQIVWAINVEMPRDCASCHQTLMNPNISVSGARDAIQRSTRWGVQGNRWIYANEFATMFHQ